MRALPNFGVLLFPTKETIDLISINLTNACWKFQPNVLQLGITLFLFEFINAIT